MKVSVSSMPMYWALPGTASGLSDEKMTIDRAAVGPDTRCQDEPKSAAIITGTMAVYSPYSGGSPAMLA